MLNSYVESKLEETVVGVLPRLGVVLVVMLKVLLWRPYPGRSALTYSPMSDAFMAAWNRAR